jgi:hypothetical protein
MNPSIEVQITARLDKLDAALKVAEAKIGASAVTMGKAGEKGGNAFIENLASKVIKGTAILGFTSALGGMLLNAVKGINAQKSGEEIMTSISDGLVAMGKSLPIVGIFYAAFEEVINGADRFAEELTKKLGAAVEKRIDSTKAMMDSLKSFTQGTADILATTGAGSDPTKILDVKDQKTEAAEIKQVNDIKEQEEQRHRDRLAAINADFDAQQKSTDPDIYRAYSSKERNAEIEKAREQHQEYLARIENEASKRDTARQTEYFAALKDANAKAAAEQKALDEKSQKDAKEMGSQMVVDWKVQQKEKYDAAVQAQQDIIDAEKQAQAQIDKIGRVDKLAADAARGMINSGQTALGQFNFVQAGAGGTALDMAKKQVMSLEKIEAATAEQVRLTKENKGFQ